ncbi:MAG: ABC transporter substrate-binding protein [Desulfovibrionaceae bacterium]
MIRRVLIVTSAAWLLLTAACSPLPTSERVYVVGVIATRDDAPGSLTHDVLQGLRDGLGASEPGAQVRIELRLDGGAPGRAAAAAAELAGNREVLAVATATSFECRMAAAEVLDRAGVAMLAPAGLLAGEGENVSRFGRVFSLLPGGRDVARSTARYAHLALGARRVLVAADRGVLHSEMQRLFQDEAARAGLGVAGVCAREPGLQDLPGCVSREVRAASGDIGAVVFFGPQSSAVAVARGLRRQGSDTPVLTLDDGLSPFVQAGGPEDVYAGAAFLWDMAPLASRRYFQASRSSRDGPPSPAAALGRDGGWLLKRAISEQGPDRERIRAHLVELAGRAEPLMGVTGPLAFEPSGGGRRRLLFADFVDSARRPALLQLPGPGWTPGGETAARQSFELVQAVRLSLSPVEVLRVDPVRGVFRARVLAHAVWRGESPLGALLVEPDAGPLSRQGAVVSEGRERGVSWRTILMEQDFSMDWPVWRAPGAPVRLPVTVSCAPEAASRLAVVSVSREEPRVKMLDSGFVVIGSSAASGYRPLIVRDGEGKSRWLELSQASRSLLVRSLLRASVAGFWLPATLPLLLGLAAMAGPRGWRASRLALSHLSLAVLLVLQAVYGGAVCEPLVYPYGWAFLLLADAVLVAGALLGWVGLGQERSGREAQARQMDRLARWGVAPAAALLWAGLTAYLW